MSKTLQQFIHSAESVFLHCELIFPSSALSINQHILMNVANTRIIFRYTLVPGDALNKVICSEDFIHDQSEFCHLRVVQTNENSSVFPQELSEQRQSRIHHTEPFVMAGGGFGVP